MGGYVATSRHPGSRKSSALKGVGARTTSLSCVFRASKMISCLLVCLRNRLTPAHVQEAGLQIFKQFSNLLFLNALANYPTAQSSVLLCLTIFHAISIWRSKSFAHLAVADSRSSMSDVFCTSIGYTFSLICSSLPHMNSSSSSSGMVLFCASLQKE